MTVQDRDVVVIGGGLAGLSAAVALMDAGRDVEVLDAGDEPGGLARSDAEGGYSFSRGPQSFLGSSPALAGRGVAWLPESLIAEQIRTRELVPAGGDGWLVPLEVRLYRQNAEMTPTAEALWRVVGGACE